MEFVNAFRSRYIYMVKYKRNEYRSLILDLVWGKQILLNIR